MQWAAFSLRLEKTHILAQKTGGFRQLGTRIYFLFNPRNILAYTYSSRYYKYMVKLK
jgi:hypothetical protein